MTQATRTGTWPRCWTLWSRREPREPSSSWVTWPRRTPPWCGVWLRGYFNAIDVLNAAGLTEADINPQYLSFGDSTDGLKDGKIQAAFIVAGAPTPAITELCATNEAYLVPIDGDVAAKLMADCPFYTAYTIPAGTYEGQTEDVKTVTVKATLIVSADASEDDVYNLTKAIFENTAAIAAENGKGAELSIENATSGMTAPFHAGAAKYFAEKGVTVETK